MNTRNTKADFWALVRKTDTCWVWTGTLVGRGYGHFGFRGIQCYAHRLSFEWENGPILPGMLICHHCDNPPCVRPSHLFQGTASDNMLDMVKKGRQGKPGVVPLERFAVDVHLIRSLLAASGSCVRRLASDVNIAHVVLARELEAGITPLPRAQKIAATLGVDLNLLRKKPLSEGELMVRLACSTLGPPFHDLLLKDVA